MNGEFGMDKPVSLDDFWTTMLLNSGQSNALPNRVLDIVVLPTNTVTDTFDYSSNTNTRMGSWTTSEGIPSFWRLTDGVIQNFESHHGVIQNSESCDSKF